MKKILGITLVIAIAFASCSKVKKLSGRLTGTWTITQKEYTYKYNNVQQPQISYIASNVAGASFEFKSDMTGKLNDPYSTGYNSSTNTHTFGVKEITLNSWMNNADHVSYVWTDPSLQTGSFTFIVNTNEKTAQVWTWNVKYSGPSASPIEEKIVYTLAKK